MLVRGDIASPKTQSDGSPLPIWHVPEDLVVGAVFLDDIHDMFETRWALRRVPEPGAAAWPERAGSLAAWSRG